jgi:hypothetical protein
VTDVQLTLRQALLGATEAPPDRRIEYRDPIARQGQAGIDAVVAWLGDPVMFRFAVRVIVRAGELGYSAEAKTALRRSLDRSVPAAARDEIAWGLAQLGVRIATSAPRGTRTKTKPITPSERLVVGNVYKRRDLHRAGWGGNWQSGVSYPASGDHVLLFSDPLAADVLGYRDSWVGTMQYRYFGAWSGSGDMVLDGVNRTILDRSPNLLLLIRSGNGWRFEGYFACKGYELQRTTHDGAEDTALVFLLERVP